MKSFTFSGGEIQVCLDDFDGNLRFNLWSSHDIMSMLMTYDAYTRFYPTDYNPPITIPYVPYARQDRIMNDGEALSIKVMANLINSMNSIQVRIWDPHSDVTPALINNCYVIKQDKLLEKVLLKNNQIQYDGIISPDVGAMKKSLEIGKKYNIPVYSAHKQRNTKTGEITKTILLDEVPSHGKFLIVDDICDGGRTFIELAKLFDSHRDSIVLDLYVTHGIFSQGIIKLLTYFNTIYVANVIPKWYSYSDPNFVQLFDSKVIL